MNSQATNKTTKKRNAALVAVSAMYAALLVGGKEALAALPNIEVVTVFTAICAFSWGLAVVLPAVNVFIAVDMAIWGVNTWLISYFIYWNLVAICFWALSKANLRKKWLELALATLLATLLTAFFGVLTTAVDTVVGFTGRGFFIDFDDLFKRFAALYATGVPFFVTHVVCNFVLFAVAFLPLERLNYKAKLRILPQDELTNELNSLTNKYT